MLAREWNGQDGRVRCSSSTASDIRRCNPTRLGSCEVTRADGALSQFVGALRLYVMRYRHAIAARRQQKRGLRWVGVPDAMPLG
jgi:hypothetical protein